jgi:hypothetical protein
MPSRELVMREASEYIAAKYAPKPDYSEYGWIAFCISMASGMIVATLFVLSGDLIRAWGYGFYLVVMGVSILVYSKHPMSSYERADIDIQWPITDRGYGSLFHEHENLALFLMAVNWLVIMVLIRFAS